MMDWLRFLDENNIPYVTRGPNTKRGEVSIKCPMCGEDDPSEHFGINLTTGYWGCHRDPSHRGKSSRILIKNILGCTSHAAQIMLQQYNHADPDNLDEAIAMLEGQPDEEKAEKRVENMRAVFNGFSTIRNRGTTKRFWNYLSKRDNDPDFLIKHYSLRCALTGRYKDRIIIPVGMNGEIFGWTSRAVTNPINAPRYLASNQEIKATLFDYDHVKKGGHRLFIVEGPFDAMRIYSAQPTNVEVHATCTFGTSATLPQIALLRTLVKKYDQAYVLFDKDAD